MDAMSRGLPGQFIHRSAELALSRACSVPLLTLAAPWSLRIWVAAVAPRALNTSFKAARTPSCVAGCSVSGVLLASATACTGLLGSLGAAGLDVGCAVGIVRTTAASGAIGGVTVVTGGVTGSGTTIVDCATLYLGAAFSGI